MLLLALDRVSVRHRVGRKAQPVLDEASLDVWPGEFIAIWGTRRAGKTTLLRVAAGIEAPTSGVIRLDGREVRTTSQRLRAQWRRHVAFVPKQWHVAQGKPVLDHVALPLIGDGWSLAASMRRAHHVLDRVGASDCAHRSVDTLLPASATRVALAQALVRQPRVLLLDEPGIAASESERGAILGLVRALASERAGLAVVIASQDARGLAGADRILPLSNGRLRDLERPAEVVPFPARWHAAAREPAS